MRRSKWNKILGAGIALSLLAGQAAFGAATIPPNPLSQESGSAGGSPGQGGGPGGAGSAGQSQGTGGPVSGGGGNSGQNQGPVGSSLSGPGGAGSSGQSQGLGGPAGAAGTSITTVVTAESPVVQSKGAALYNVNTGEFLYTKDADGRYYPASITKLMTALLVIENCGLDDSVTFSKTAVTNLESGSVTLKLTEGDRLTVRQCLYGLLLKSANEVANGLAEHVSGSVGGFAAKMNERAKAIGCTGTNFVNPNGLNHSNHYTTPHDMALIGAEAFKNSTLCQIDSTLSYQFPATKLAGERTISMGHKMLHPSDSRYYPGIVGGKTGYTSLAGNTLVTCAEKDGVRLVAVVLKSSQTHYQDTRAMLDYGFAVESGGGARWVEDADGWYFVNKDKSRPAGQWMNINGIYYWFDSDGYMAKGWRQSGGSWYYLKPSSGAMAANYWVQTDGKWYYLGSDGAMLKNATTPDGYRVDGDGVWVQ